MAVKRLAWDSEFFGFEIGEFNLEQSFDSPDGYRLLYVKNPEEFKMEIEGFTPTYSETKLVFSKKLNQLGKPISTKINDSIRDLRIESLYELAFESGKYSRFNKDPNFEESDFKKMYTQWIDSSLSRKYADGFLFYVDQGTLCGFVTYRISGDFATIGLIAVSPEMQGRGIGQQLLTTVESTLFEKGIYELRIPTQNTNLSACSFYAKMGYKIYESTVIKHYWRDK